MAIASWRPHVRVSVLAAFLFYALVPALAHAHQFGRNKVQYDKLQFRVLKTTHFDIYYYEKEADAVQQVGRLAERWYERLSKLLTHQLNGRQPIILYASHPEFSQTNVVEGELGEGTGGVTEGERRRVILPMAASLEDTDHVLGHELVHAFQYDILGRNIEGLPLWFIEGMAEYLSLGPRDVQTGMWLRDALIREKLPTLDQLDDPRYFPYRFGHAFWAYVGGRFGDAAVAQILNAAGPALGQEGPGYGLSAIEAVTGRDKKTLSAEWQRAISQAYQISASPTTGIVIGEPAKNGSIAVGPALSPDGSRLAFLSSRGLVSIDLYLADATTGKVTSKLISTATDPHFESLQFLASAGAWDPAGRQLAVGTIRNGRPVLALIDAANGSIVREIKVDDVDEIFQPSWSPDGRSLAFAAQVGGVTDLFVLDFADGSTRRLTRDSFADLQPAWSPDGTRLAFVTDRFGANPETLSSNGNRLAILTIASGAITPIDTGLAGNAINPQWLDQGRAICFLSDAGGRSNVYRVDLGAGARAVKLTDEFTGVAGITPASPALSVSATSGKAAVSVFQDSGYEIRMISTTAPEAPLAANIRNRDLAMLPPEAHTAEIVPRFLETPAEGLPPATALPTEKYSPKLSLVSISQGIGFSTGNFGGYASGGVSLVFSDVLGDHQLTTGFSIDGGARDAAVSVNYLNRRSRWNWGVFTQRIPMLSGSVQTSIGSSGGRPTYVQETDLFRQTFTEAGALVAYPLSRATRIELSAAARHISFDHELRTQTADYNTGQLLSDDKTSLSSDPSMNMSDVTAAFVRDTSVFAGTSPIMGQRARFEVSPTFGNLRMVNVNLDYRHYVMPVRPVTLAVRALHLGRYGASAQDERLMPLFLGYSTLVRGYDVGTFRPTDCPPAGTACPQFNRLVGSRLLVLNGEVRAPLVGLFRGRLEYGPLPVEVFGFADSGVAWTAAERPAFAGGSRDWVTSVGGGARVNVLGYAIAELNMVRPLDRPGRGWLFVFNLRSGF